MPGSSDTRSQGKMTRSEVMAFWTSGERRRSPVPLVWVRPRGAMISGFGLGKDVRAGFVANAASNAGRDSGGVTKVMSVRC